MIDELVAWHEETDEPNLAQVEAKVLNLWQRLSEQMSQAVIAKQEAVRPVPGPACDRCGQEMRYKDMKKVRVSSWVGELKIDRGYYYCEHCRTGLFPLDRQFELWDKHGSAGLVKAAVWLSGVMGSFEQAEETFARLGHIKMSDKTIWRRAKKWGQQF